MMIFMIGILIFVQLVSSIKLTKIFYKPPSNNIQYDDARNSFIAANYSSSQITKTNLKASVSIASLSVAAPINDQLTYYQSMAAGALSRAMAQTLMHPANTYKTLLQLRDSNNKNVIRKLSLRRLFRGADAQFLLSLPHGAFYFVVIDQVKYAVQKYFPNVVPFIVDFTASSISTVLCSIVSTPQMVLTDRLMAGRYATFPAALKSIMTTEGPRGFYTGWWPALAQKIPSYGLTWMFFQQLKRTHEHYLKCKPSTQDNFILGAVAAAASVCVMIPMDTIKTRLVTQINGPKAYKGVMDCFSRVLREEGPKAFYRSLPPRLLSVVPMIAIQFGVYEAIKLQVLRQRGINRCNSCAAETSVSTSPSPSAQVTVNTDKPPINIQSKISGGSGLSLVTPTPSATPHSGGMDRDDPATYVLADENSNRAKRMLKVAFHRDQIMNSGVFKSNIRKKAVAVAILIPPICRSLGLLGGSSSSSAGGPSMTFNFPSFLR